MERVVALLFMLADLAERAAGRSLAVRWTVMWSLWMAHDIAADFIADCACDDIDAAWAPALPEVRRGHDPADALALALSLRTLALMLGTLAAQARCLSRLSAALEGSDGAPVGRVVSRLSRLLSDRTVAAAVRLDTS